MSGIIDSYKKVFENKQAHVWLAIVALIWSVTSTLLDIKLGNGDTPKNNIIDLVFSLLIGVYSLQFIHNAINNINNGLLPSIKEVQPKIIWGMIKLNIVWGIYAVLVLILAFISYIATHLLFLPILIVLALLILSAPVYYIFLAYAEDLNTKGLYNIAQIFSFFKVAYKPLYINVCLYILTTLAALIIYIMVYVVAGLIGIDEIGMITKDYYVMDIIMNAIASYILIITWYFAYPYSLIPSYKENIRPLLTKTECFSQKEEVQ